MLMTQNEAESVALPHGFAEKLVEVLGVAGMLTETHPPSFDATDRREWETVAGWLDKTSGLITIGRDANGREMTLDNQHEADGGMVQYSLLSDQCATNSRDGAERLRSLLFSEPVKE